MRSMIRTAAGSLMALSMGLFSHAAPAPKEKATEDKPETEEMHAASKKNLRVLALGMFNYEANFSKFPGNLAKDGKDLLSWRVQLLPFLEAEGDVPEGLHQQFKLDEPWDSEHNKKLIPKIPKVFAPLRGKAKAGETYYQSFAGKGAFLQPGGLPLLAIADGLSNTLMVAEAETAVVWTKPDDIPFDGKARPALGGMFKDYFHVAMADGSVRRVPKTVDTHALVSSITTANGEVADLDTAIRSAEKK